MALPTTITGISTAIPCVGPFKLNAVASGDTIVQTDGGSVSSNWGDGSSNQQLGQIYTANDGTYSYPLNSVTFWVSRVGSPADNLVVDIYAAGASGNVAGSVLGTSNAIAATSASVFPAAPTACTFTFASPLLLPPNSVGSNQYIAVIRRTGAQDATKYFQLEKGSGSTGAVVNNGTSWSTSAQSFQLTINSSGTAEAYFFFGRDGTTAGQLDAMKATDPTTSFSQIGNTTSGLLTTIQWIAGFQVFDVVHLIVCSESTITAVKYEYVTFNMASGTFVLAETIASALNTEDNIGTPQYGCSLTVRSSGEVVVFFNGAHLAVMGSSWARVYYSRRTAVNTWSAAVEVDAGGTADAYSPVAVLGASDAIHFAWWTDGASSGASQRTLNSSNILQTASTTISGDIVGHSGISYNNSGTQEVVISGGDNGSGGNILHFASSNTPTLSSAQPNTSSVFFNTPFNDVTDVWIVYAHSALTALYAAKSTDNGATYGSETSIFTSTALTSNVGLTINGNIYQRGSNFVIPYVVNDNGTLKYNEYVVRTSGITLTLVAGALVIAGATSKLSKSYRAVAAALTFTGGTAVRSIGKTLSLVAGALSLSGATPKLTQAYRAVAGSLSFTGRAVSFSVARYLTVVAGSLSLVGRVTRMALTMRVVAGGLTLAGATPRMAWAQRVAASALTLSGAPLKVTNLLRAVASSLALTGRNSQIVADYRAVAGALTLTGRSARLANALRAVAGSLTLTGRAVSFTITSGQIVLTVVAGALALTGRVTPAGSAMALVAGTLILQGRAGALVGLLRAKAGSLVLTGGILAQALSVRVSAAALTLTGRGGRLAAGMRVHAGALLLAGGTASTVLQMRLQAGALALTGGVSGLARSFRAIAGSLTLTGRTAKLSTAFRVAAGTLTLVGRICSMGGEMVFAVVAGALSLVGGSAALTATARIIAGAMTLAGATPRMAIAYRAVAGALSLTGRVVNLSLALVLRVVAGALALTGRTPRIASAMAVRAGLLTLAGGQASLTMALRIAAGSLTLAGATVRMASAAVLVVVAGALSLAPATASMANALRARAGALTLAGGTTRLTNALRAVAGVLTLSGGRVQIGRALIFVVVAGTLTLTGGGLSMAAAITVVAGMLALSGLTVRLGPIIAKVTRLLGSLVTGRLLATRVSNSLQGSEVKPALGGTKTSTDLAGSEIETDLEGQP